jgi:hypothetical protein
MHTDSLPVAGGVCPSDDQQRICRGTTRREIRQIWLVTAAVRDSRRSTPAAGRFPYLARPVSLPHPTPLAEPQLGVPLQTLHTAPRSTSAGGRRSTSVGSQAPANAAPSRDQTPGQSITTPDAVIAASLGGAAHPPDPDHRLQLHGCLTCSPGPGPVTSSSGPEGLCAHYRGGPSECCWGTAWGPGPVRTSNRIPVRPWPAPSSGHASLWPSPSSP